MLWGGELVLRDGPRPGQVMSAAWGETLGACVGLAYVWDPRAAIVDRDWVDQQRLRGRRQRLPLARPGRAACRCSTRTVSGSRGEAEAYLALTTSITNHSVEFGGILAPLPWAPYA